MKYKLRDILKCYSIGSAGGSLPFIRVAGRWLNTECDIYKGDSIKIVRSKGKIVLTKVVK